MNGDSIMTKTLERLLGAACVALALAAATAVPDVEAAPARQVAAPNNRVDARATNVRNTSVNNVNVNRNVNVHVDNNGCCHGGWDNDYHPVATAAAVTATVAVTSAVVGSIVNRPPAGCVPVNYRGVIYQQCAGTWYMPQGPQYVIVMPPY
jgi:hypothetical protein